jgi:hypothetical protein
MKNLLFSTLLGLTLVFSLYLPSAGLIASTPSELLNTDPTQFIGVSSRNCLAICFLSWLSLLCIRLIPLNVFSLFKAKIFKYYFIPLNHFFTK